MTNYYEALGIPEDATQPAIKAAWRRKSSKAHPDKKGGSKEAQQAINDAYAVLGDPERRKRYDQGGSGKKEAALADRARANMLELFAQHLGARPDEPNPIQGLRVILQGNRATALDEQGNFRRMAEKLLRHVGKIRRKTEGENQLLEVIKERHRSATELIGKAQENIDLIDAILVELDNYECDMPPPTFPIRPGTARWSSGAVMGVDYDR